ncbi:hypothetical protein SAMN02745166_00589 [Prosthecobacter debontii]|uniref:Tetratricopeptide repeat-containing protein n=1 Tax=Prosthecobacter debontii TaxID=48467 RepID=A0A1T4WRZ1_9BACT|nr:hypothetical protein [Prosthecobacter debontii]SKA80142.1 hypothetical protein SAMN02745166_00589 [Prosthecobacter debontii]
MKRNIQALLVLLLLGIIKLPVEQAATGYLRQQRLLSPPPDMSVRDSIGQMGFAASLGGLRSLVASILYLQAYDAWTNINWAKVDSLFQLITSLQPRFDRYWDEAAWHMAYNAASSYLNNQKLNSAVRGKLFHDHIQRGVDILQQGLRFNPNSARLWNTLAETYERRVHDPKKAAECYLEVARVMNNARYARLAGYQYAQTSDPELWRKGYDLLKASYDRGQRQPTLINTLKQLEHQLKLPATQRIPDAPVPVQIERGATGP